MSDEQGHQPSGGDAGTERALDELRVALERLATRMGAGFREDLAQIRAIASSVAERDLTPDIEALRVDVAALVGRDAGTEVRTELAAVRAELARLASGDDLAGVRAQLSPLQASLDRISSRLDDDSGRTQVLARFEALEARLDQLVGGDGDSSEVLSRIDALAERLDALPTAQQTGNLAGDLRAHLADALGGLDGDVLMRELTGLRSQLGDGHGTVVDQLQDNLADVASGEVVGALWDEVRQLRADLPDLIAVPEPVTAAPGREPDPQLSALTDELSVLRAELAEGLVVEPSDALAGSLDALRAEVDGLRDALGELRAAPEPVSPEPADDGRDERLLAQLGAIEAAVDDVRSRLDEGLVLADDTELPPADDATDGPGLDAIADQIAALRDFVASELDTVRETVSARLDQAADATAATVAAITARPEPEAAPVQATVDPETVELLLTEIRSAGRADHEVAGVVQAEIGSLRSVLEELRGAPASEIATIRDLVASELEIVRQAMSVRLDAAAEETAAAVASIAGRPEPGPATLDPETLDLLLGEVRAAGRPGDADDGPRHDELLAEMRTVHAGIEALRVRLDEAAVPASGGDPGAEGGGNTGEVDALADQIAALRDFLASELDTVQRTVSSGLEAAAEATVTAATTRSEPVPASIDPETVGMLRDEIRAAGAIGDQVVDALREELKALRRRIAIKASERVLDEQQLAQIADAVAARLAADG